MTRRYALRDDQWNRIELMLPGRKGHVGVTARDNRRFVEAVLYRYRAGIPWRDLPERFGDFRVVHTRFSRWSRSGMWERVFHALAQDGQAGLYVPAGWLGGWAGYRVGKWHREQRGEQRWLVIELEPASGTPRCCASCGQAAVTATHERAMRPHS